MSHEFALGLLDGHVDVTCARPDTAAWLREMLLPAFCDRDGPSDAIKVAVGTSSGAASAVSDNGGLVPCFALDREVVHLPGLRVGDDTVVDDEYFAAQYAVSPTRVDVRPAGRPRLLGASFRVVRELAVAQAATPARGQLHASAVAVDGRVVLFAGPKEGGKTTTSVHVAASTGAAIVSNDRTLVGITEDGWVAHGVPTIVHVRAGTIARLLHLGWPPRGDDEPVMSTLEQLRQAPVRPAAADTTAGLTMSLAQFARAAEAPLVAGGALASVAFVRVDEAVAGFEVRSLSTTEAAGQLAADRFGASTEPRPATVFEQALGWHESRRPAPDLLPRLASEVRCVDLRVGGDFLRDAAGPRRLLEQLLDR